MNNLRCLITLCISLYTSLAWCAREAYVVVEDSVMTFYYDELRDTHHANTYLVEPKLHGIPSEEKEQTTHVVFSPSFADTLTYSVYPNAYVSINGNRWTKHYYVGFERIVSRTGTLGDFNSLNADDNYSAGFSLGINVDYDNMCHAEEDSITAMYERFEVPYDVQHANSRGKAGHLLIPITIHHLYCQNHGVS